jgi:hypothetical protein
MKNKALYITLGIFLILIFAIIISGIIFWNKIALFLTGLVPQTIFNNFGNST